MNNFGSTILYFTDYLRVQNFTNLWKKNQQISSKFTITKIKHYPIEASYQFIIEPTENCQKLLFIEPNAAILPSVDQEWFQTHRQLAFTSSVLINNKTESLKDLSTEDLAEIDQKELRKYAFVMERKLLFLLSPFNFAYNNFYTFHELLIYPALALTQSSPFVGKLDKAIHEIMSA